MVLEVDEKCKADNIKELVEKFMNKNRTICDQLVNPPEYPKTIVLAKFAKLAYTENTGILPELYLSEWKFIGKACSNKNNYQGIAYFNPDKMHIVIAHKGTRDLKDYYTDLKGIYFNKPTGQVFSACTFVNKIIEAVKQIQSEYKKLHFQIFITGHSLGGWLAQITSFSSKYLETKNERFVKRNDTEGIHTHTVAFDSPGCKEMLEKLEGCYFGKYNYPKPLEYLDINTYLSSPNVVNIVNKHFGKVFRLKNSFESFSTLEMIGNYTKIVHAIKNIISFFEKENPSDLIANVLNWPHGLTEYGRSFFQSDMFYYFENYKKLEHQIRYTESLNKNEIYKNEFSQNEMNFLKFYDCLKQHKSGILENISEELSYPEIPKEDFEKVKKYLNFDISENDTITCHSSYGTQNFIAVIKKILFFYPEITKTLGRISSEMNYKFYEGEKKDYERIINEINISKKFYNRDFLQLCKSDSYIWQFKTNNTNLCMMQLYSELKTLKSNFTMIKLERLLLFNTFNSFESLLNNNTKYEYIVIECDNQDNNEYVENSLIDVLGKLKPNIHIIVVTNERVVLKQECFNDIKSESVHLSFYDLNSEIQNEIFDKKCITLNNNQNKEVSLKDVLKTDNITKEMNVIISPEIISHILFNNKINIDTDFVKTQLCDYYIGRTFMYANYNIFSEEKMVEKSLEEEIVILSDKAGMGKSMIFTKVFEVMKNDQQQLWLLKINFNKYTKEFEEQKSKIGNFNPKNSTEVIDLFIALFFKTRSETEIDKFRNELLKYNLKNKGNVVIFFDTYDGVSSQYNKIVLDLLVGLKYIGIKCMWIATRTHCKNKLVNKLEVEKSYSIEPFSEENQKDFLHKYWNSILNKPNEDNTKNKINQFSTKTVTYINFLLNGKELLSIPLHIYMLAEYYKNDCIDICNSSNSTVEEVKFNNELVITNLYKHIVNTKINDFVKCLDDTNHPNVQNIISYFKNKITDEYEHLALSLYNQKTFKRLGVKPCDVKKLVKINIGFIDSTDGYEVVFTPTTLLDYFVFIYIEKHIIHRWDVFEMLFLDALKDSNKQILRLFLNDYLEKKIRTCLTRKHRKNLNKQKLRHNIILQSTEEGTVNILKFISEYFENTDELKKLINAKNERGETALHIAAQKGECEIVTILLTALHKVDRKVDEVLLSRNQDIINVKDYNQMTPLHKAAQNGHAGVVKILIDNKAKIDIINKNGRTALEEAESRGHQNVVDILPPPTPILLN